MKFLHINLLVKDIGAAREFYARVLGLCEIPRTEGVQRPGAWFKLGDVEIHLAEDARQSVETSTRHFAARVSDLDAFRTSLLNAGAPIETDRPLPNIRRFFTRDPSGNRIELQEQLERFDSP